MLHSSTLHYYACYCALICLLCQQHCQHQQANAVTIIIDGASSNEWATRDEYQRLADPAGAGSGNGESSQQQELGVGGGARAGVPDGALTGGERFAAANEADLADLLATKGAAQRRLVATDETGNSFRNQQQKHEQLRPAEEFDLALDRLDLIERERLAEVARLRELQALERDAESSAARALSHQAQATGAQINVAEIPPDAYVAMAKANRRRKQRDVPKRRCGEDLTKALEFVCKHRFYNGGGDTQPEVVQPVIKSKRSVDNQLDQRMAAQKLRTLQQQQRLHDGNREFGTEDGDGGPASTSLSLSSPLQHSSSSQLKPELSSLSSSISSSSLLLNNDGIDNTPHNHHLQQQRELQQQQRQQKQSVYLSNHNRYRGEGGDQEEEEAETEGQGGSSSNSNLRDKIRSKKALLRRIRGASEECCERSCTYADMEAYCAASSQAQAAAA